MSDPDSGRVASDSFEAAPSPEVFTHRTSSRLNSLSRGRDLQTLRVSHRLGTSAPPARGSQAQIQIVPQRTARSESPSTSIQFSPSTSSDESSSDPADSMDTDEDYEDFWGGESPGSRAGWASPLGRTRKDKNNISDDDDNENNDDINDDEDDTDMSDDEDDDDDDDDDVEVDRMEIFGHR